MDPPDLPPAEQRARRTLCPPPLGAAAGPSTARKSLGLHEGLTSLTWACIGERAWGRAVAKGRKFLHMEREEPGLAPAVSVLAGQR